MKSMTCNQLGGACEKVFEAEAFEDLAAQSQAHGREMMTIGDESHLSAMNQMMEIMNAGQMDAWMNDRRAEFDAL